MGAPQIIWIVLASIAVTVAMVRDGQPRTDNHSFAGAMFGVSVMAGLLWWGGFFG